MRPLMVALLALMITTRLTAQERCPMTTDDALDMVRVGGALMSPDGSWGLFSKSELDWGENERKTTWWRAAVDGFREPRHQRTRDVEEIRWIQKYVRGIEWDPWERPTKAEPKVISQ